MQKPAPATRSNQTPALGRKTPPNTQKQEENILEQNVTCTVEDAMQGTAQVRFVGEGGKKTYLLRPGVISIPCPRGRRNIRLFLHYDYRNLLFRMRTLCMALRRRRLA